MKKGLSKGLRRFYGVGDLAFTLMTQVQDVYFNFFLTNIALFDLGITTLITTVTTAIDAALSWIYGAIINGSKPMKWGRYRSWLVILPWIVPFIYSFKFMVVGSTATAMIIIIAAGVISSIIWNFPYVANMSLIAAVGKTPEDRVQLASSRATYNRASSILFSYMGLPLANVFAGVVGANYKFAALAFFLSVLMVIGYFVHFKLTEGYDNVLIEAVETESIISEEAQKNKKKDTGRASGKGMIKALFQNGPLLVLMLAEMARWLANFVILGCAIYYFTYVAQNVALMAIYLLISNIACMVGAFSSKYIVRKTATKTTYIFSYFLMAAGLVIARFLYMNPWAVIALMTVAQFGYGCIYSLSPAMFADSAVFAEWKTGENASGWIMGLGNVPLKVALVLRGLLINGILAAAGFSAKIAVADATVAVKSAIANTLMLVPGIALIFGAVILIFGFKLSKEQVKQMSIEIAQRKL